MKKRIEIALILVGLLMLLTGIARLMRHGDLPSVRAAFSDYLPGRPRPTHLSCQEMEHYYMGYRESAGSWQCQVDSSPLCERVYVYGSHDTIRAFMAFRCHFPVAALIADYGWWEGKRRYASAYYLAWPQEKVAAIVRYWRVEPMATVWHITFFGS